MSKHPFHRGELTVQHMAGERSTADRNSAVIGPAIPPTAIPFLAKQRLMAVATIDEAGTPWPSVMVADHQFIEATEDGTHLTMTWNPRVIPSGDGLRERLSMDPRIGLLAIDFDSRRRLRINGKVLESNSTSSVIEIAESFSLCPRYIQRRQLSAVSRPQHTQTDRSVASDRLDDSQWAMLQRADTLFVASVNEDDGLDVSHRGGPVGFVERVGPARLRLPDYAGNSLFNTLGNLYVTPRAGIVVLDFDTGNVLQVAGRSTLRFDQRDPRGLTGGTGRFWELEIEAVREGALSVDVAWQYLDASPFNPQPTDS